MYLHQSLFSFQLFYFMLFQTHMLSVTDNCIPLTDTTVPCMVLVHNMHFNSFYLIIFCLFFTMSYSLLIFINAISVTDRLRSAAVHVRILISPLGKLLQLLNLALQMLKHPNQSIYLIILSCQAEALLRSVSLVCADTISLSTSYLITGIC